MKYLDLSCGLTTTKAPFIEKAKLDGQIFIHHSYELYTEANHSAWKQLYTLSEPQWQNLPLRPS